MTEELTSMVGRLFGRRKGSGAASKKDAEVIGIAISENQRKVDDMRRKLQLDELAVRRLRRQLDDAVEARNRDEAIRLRRQIEVKSKALAATRVKLENLENLTTAVDTMSEAVDIQKTYVATRDALRAQKKSLDLDEVDSVVDDLEEIMEDVGSVEQAFTRPIRSPTAASVHDDPESIEDEIDALFAERALSEARSPPQTELAAPPASLPSSSSSRRRAVRKPWEEEE